jgi:hypothetical protein
LSSPGVTKDTSRLIQQAIKYYRVTKAPIIMFYDYNCLLALKAPPELLQEKPDVLLNAAVWKEPNKSTENAPVLFDNNRVAMLMRYTVLAVQMCEARSGT